MKKGKKKKSSMDTGPEATVIKSKNTFINWNTYIRKFDLLIYLNE